MNRIVFFISAVVLCVSNIGAQNKTTLLQRINEIKRQKDIFFWDQATFQDADTAKYVAAKRLLMDINNYRSGLTPLSVEEVMSQVSFIKIDRGNLKQYFAYIRITDAAALKSEMMSSISTKESDIGIPIKTSGVTSQVLRSFVPDAFVQRIMETRDFLNVYKLLKSLQSQGQILQFGKLKDVEDYSSLDLILFDMQSQEIVTMLSPATASGNRINVVNGTEDSLDNYPTNMTAVIWYIKK